jgi:MSHA type pilus biogenesis protein MshL
MKITLSLIVVAILAGCQYGPERSERMDVSGHINDPAPAASEDILNIPPVVEQLPIVVAPEPVEKLQTFTVVVADIPANELLFALARDARLNLDIDPSITGRVSINAIDQTLPQILRRISRQVSLRYYMDGPNLVVEQDQPFTRLYRIDYLNMSRTTSSTTGIQSSLVTGSDSEGGSSGDSTATVTNSATNEFWKSLEENIKLLASLDGVTNEVVSNRESGTISVLTSSVAHENIQHFLDNVMGSARRQVLIEATIVEVTLNDDFQAGVDWSKVAGGNGWDLTQSVLSEASLLPDQTGFISAIFNQNPNSSGDITSVTIEALDAFGDVSVMSSPKIMALNNQTSILKVATNVVYFEVDVTSNTLGGTTATVTQTFNTTPKTVPVGFVMNVTPFITSDNEVILNIRPTISRVLTFVIDPNPLLLGADPPIENRIPIIQVREMESVLRVGSGDTAVIGGLMEDTAERNSSGIPGLHDVEGLGFLFGSRKQQLNKTELVIFLRPRIIDIASIDNSLKDFQRYLETPEIFKRSGE